LSFLRLNDLKVNYHKTMKRGKIRPLTPETGVQVPVGLPIITIAYRLFQFGFLIGGTFGGTFIQIYVKQIHN